MDEAARVRTALDNQTMEEELPAGKLISQHGIAEQLLIFLSVLPERVIPQSYYKEIIASAGSVETAKAMVDKLPLVHKQCFLRLVRTLKILLDNQKINTLSLEFVSTLFNSLLFVPPTSMAQNHDYRSFGNVCGFFFEIFIYFLQKFFFSEFFFSIFFFK